MAPGIMLSRPLPLGASILVRIGCTAWPLEVSTMASRAAAMQRSIGRVRRTSAAPRILSFIAVSKRLGWSFMKLIL